MSEIDALQQRLTAAMDRIASGMGALGSAAAGNSEALETALVDEKLANAQLGERVRKLAEKQEAVAAKMAAAQEAAQARTAELDLELQRLRKANDQLRQSNAALRKANEEGVGEPHLINKAMMAELEALRAARAADVAETSSIIGALAPLLDQLDAPEEENA
jgi:DNA repair exonuclease SbcCD ATPase subunit